MSLEAQDGPTIRTTCGVLILLFIVISVQANAQAIVNLNKVHLQIEYMTI